jgi:hypothetical protein
MIMNAPEQTVQHVKTSIDTALAAGAISTPWWVQSLQTYVGSFMLIGGAVLLVLRLVITWNEWQAQRKREGN